MTLLATCGVLAGCGLESGTEWVRADSKTTQSLESIHGSGPNDVWAVGRLGAIIHWNGTQWSVVEAGTSVDLHAFTLNRAPIRLMRDCSRRIVSKPVLLKA